MTAIALLPDVDQGEVRHGNGEVGGDAGAVELFLVELLHRAQAHGPLIAAVVRQDIVGSALAVAAASGDPPVDYGDKPQPPSSPFLRRHSGPFLLRR